MCINFTVNKTAHVGFEKEKSKLSPFKYHIHSPMFILRSASFVVTNLHSSAINKLYQDSTCDAPGIGNQKLLEKYIRVCARARATFCFCSHTCFHILTFYLFEKGAIYWLFNKTNRNKISLSLSSYN